MKCENCGLIIPATATRCDCGYDFEYPLLSVNSSVQWPDLSRVLGQCAICCSLSLLAYVIGFGLVPKAEDGVAQVLIYPGFFLLSIVFPTVNPHNAGIVMIVGVAIILDVLLYGFIMFFVWRTWAKWRRLGY